MCTSVASCLSGFRISGGAWCCSNALLPCNLLGELARLLPLPCLVSAAAWRLACLRAHCIAAAGAGPPLARAPKLAGAQQQRGRQVATRLLRLAPAAGLCAAGRLDAARGLTSISTRPVAAQLAEHFEGQWRAICALGQLCMALNHLSACSSRCSHGRWCIGRAQIAKGGSSGGRVAAAAHQLGGCGASAGRL